MVGVKSESDKQKAEEAEKLKLRDEARRKRMENSPEDEEASGSFIEQIANKFNAEGAVTLRYIPNGKLLKVESLRNDGIIAVDEKSGKSGRIKNELLLEDKFEIV
jgi:hypothetical protein